MWNWWIFLPTGVMLLYLAWRLTLTSPTGGAAVARMATAAWAVSWISIVGFMLVAGRKSTFEFVAQRDFGYYLGSAAFLAIPFVLVGLASSALNRQAWGSTRKMVFAVAAASLGIIFVPGLFFSGWVVGCVFSGYSSCM
jgi:hypothetical protein